ncbi:MAG: D-alanyl-D-alanine carboxypeptidase [Gammaproteobacteria bacterium]|nr:D-alanyl-D-alanine carboxypeptidase [Gammaproteobacteria bacterium]
MRLLFALLLLLPLSAFAVERPPNLNAQAWLLVDYDSASVIAEHNADKPLPPASLTKLMSIYLVFEKLHAGKLRMTDMISVSENAARTSGSQLRLRAGASVRVEDLIRGMLLRSANDATVALAEHVGGSETQFVADMNARARSWNLSGTHFMNPYGLDTPGHTSTARDLTRISMALIRDFPEYYRFFSLREFTFRRASVRNSNRLLWYDRAVDGMKTGYTSQAGYCLVASARHGSMRLIAAVLGSPRGSIRMTAGKRLLDYGFRNYETRLLFAANQTAAEARVWQGQDTVLPLGTGQNLYLTLPRGWHPRVRTQMTLANNLSTPVKLGQHLGVLALQLDNKVFAQYPLVALKAVANGTFTQQTVDNLRLWFHDKPATPAPVSRLAVQGPG